MTGVSEQISDEFPARSLEKSDAELVKACRRGDQSAWDEIVERFQRLVFAVPRRAGLSESQAADVLQEVFLTLFEKLDEIEQPEKIRAWLVTTAKFKTWSAARGEKNSRLSNDAEEIEAQTANFADAAPLADAVLIELEQQHLIRTALEKLEEKCRTILSMIYLREPSATYLEVAKQINVGETSISPLRARCLKKLAKILKS